MCLSAAHYMSVYLASAGFAPKLPAPWTTPESFRSQTSCARPTSKRSLYATDVNPYTHPGPTLTCQGNVYGAAIMTYSYCESSPGSLDECSSAPGGCRVPTLWIKPTDLSHKPACRQLGNYIHHCRLLFILSSKVNTYFTVPRRVEG